MKVNALAELKKELKTEFCNVSIRYSGKGYSVNCADGKTEIVCENNVQLAKALVEVKKRKGCLQYRISGQPLLEFLGVMFDVSRNAVLNADSVKHLIRLAALMGYNRVMLYMEDIYDIESRPYFGYLRGKYSKKELREFDEYASAFDIELIPCIQTLAHLGTVKKWWTLGDMFDLNDILLCDDEKTYSFIEDMFAALRSCLKTKIINIGMDEADMVGLGKHLKQYGFSDKFELLLRHLNRVCKIAKKYSFEPMMWSDMFFRIANDGEYYGKNEIPSEVKRAVPEGVSLVYWDYRSTDTEHYDRMIKAHKSFRNKIIVADTAWKCNGFAPHNRFTFETFNALLPAMQKNEVKNFFTTCWGDNGAECSVYSVLPSLVYIAEKCYKGEFDFEGSFYAITGINVEQFLALDSLNEMGRRRLKNEAPSKYFLYNDLFFGYLDTRYEDKFKEDIRLAAKNLEGVNAGEYSPVFETLKALCCVLEIRLGLGKETRTAYKRGDKNKIKGLCEKEYPLLIERLKVFHKRLYEQWMWENKPHGFEVQDIRLGGLIQRTQTCLLRLQNYLNTSDCLPELEESILPFHWRNDDLESHIDIFNWSNFVTVNNL